MRAYRSCRIQSFRLVPREWGLGVVLCMMLMGGGTQTVYAQLISPGELSKAHQDLSGIRNCTSCHQLGGRGIKNARCLSCHTPMEERLRADEGFHATVADQNCADCHSEHHGPTFELIRWDRKQFDHTKTGYALEGQHREASCRSCHRPEYITDPTVRRFKREHGALDSTYLGLSTTCRTCHESESPHRGQFQGQSCGSCHTAETWDEAPSFDHDDARFALTGRHVDVSCQSCHAEQQEPSGEPHVQYTGLAFETCAACHEDVHEGEFGTTCSSCHSTSGWSAVERMDETTFDHSTTGFPLVGAHAETTCRSCHQTPPRRDDDFRFTLVAGTRDNTYPAPNTEDKCQSCHRDEHDGAFADRPDGANCANCHTQTSWQPTTFGPERHDDETSFALTGAHQATRCTSCHTSSDDRIKFEFASTECATCHDNTQDNPHAGQFASASGRTTCETCHTTERWDAAPRFDHDTTEFALTGAHATASCASCHTETNRPSGAEVVQYHGLDTSCRSCHADDTPHRGQFAGTSCQSCHDTETFAAAPAFDHSTTDFALTGGHAGVACQSCHTEERAPDGTLFVRYRPLSTTCSSCHQ